MSVIALRAAAIRRYMFTRMRFGMLFCLILPTALPGLMPHARLPICACRCFASQDFRHRRLPFGIRASDEEPHMDAGLRPSFVADAVATPDDLPPPPRPHRQPRHAMLARPPAACDGVVPGGL